MRKEYLHVEAQVELLERRGMSCDAQTARVLCREGYYAVVNGYGKAFIDASATRAAGEDRFVPGTAFSHVYALYCFDRELRMLTFSELTRIESILRSVAAAAFLEAHDGPEDYLDEQSFSSARHYLLGERNFERDLRHTISTLARLSHEHEHDERGRDDARLAHYRENYEHVPLWVVFSDFSYGNLYHFIALMRRREQEVACARLVVALTGEKPRGALTRHALVADVGLQVEVRNICAHGERLFDARVGERDAYGYAQFAHMLRRYLSDEDWEEYAARLAGLLDAYGRVSERIERVLAQTRMREAVARA